jgi:hypothetical protein
MPDQYDIDYAQQVIELLPPDKRFYNMATWLQTCANQLQWLRDAVLGDYRNGSTVSAWINPLSSGTPYTIGNKVNYKNAIYVSIVSNNTDIPTNANSWYKQQDNFIGLNERLAFNGTNLVLTYALNRWFGTTFRQPGSGLSDIYITTNAIIASAFIVGSTDYNSSTVGLSGSSGFIDGALPFPQFNANINVPKAFFDSLQPAADALIGSFTDQYIYGGVTYQIVTY